MKNDEMTDDEMTEEEQRFNNMLDGLEEEYDDLLGDDYKRLSNEMSRNAIYCVVGLVGIIVLVWAGFYFDLYSVS